METARFLAERIGEGRIIGINKWLGFYRAIRKNVGNLMDKVVLVYDDMKRMDYLKDYYFDLVVSYATIESISSGAIISDSANRDKREACFTV